MSRALALCVLFIGVSQTTPAPLAAAERLSVRRYTTADGLASDRVHRILLDSRGLLWFATADGLSSFDGHTFRSYGAAHGLAPALLTDIIESRDGAFWIATYGGGVYRFDPLRHASEARAATNRGPKPQPLYTHFAVGDRPQTNRVNALFEDRAGLLWAGTDDGLYRFQPSDGSFRLVDLGPVARAPQPVQVRAFAHDDTGAMWIGTSLGLMRRDRKENVTLVTGPPPDGTSQVQALALDNHARLWAGLRDGLAVLQTATDSGRVVVRTQPIQDLIDGGALGVPRASNDLYRYSVQDRDGDDSVPAVRATAGGRVWIGLHGAVVLFDGQRARRFGSDEGIPDDRYLAIEEDRGGTLWLGSHSRGVVRVVGSDFSTSHSSERQGARVPLSILIASVRMGGVGVPVAETGEANVTDLTFGSDPRLLEIAYFGVTGNVGEPVRYQYRLEGADTSWSEPTDERTVRYVRLAPGSYRFAVRAVTPHDGAFSVPATVAFSIAAPFWRRWWFLLLVGISLAAFVYVAAQYRLQAALELERVRTRIATDLHDDIGAGLSRMAILAEVVKRQVEPSVDQSITGRMLTDIAESARELVDSMSDIVWSIDPRRDDLESLTRRVRQFASTMLEAQGIRWQFDAPLAALRLKLSPEQRRHLLLFYKEAINNIARHADCRTAVFTLELAGSQLVARARDDGRGVVNQPAPRTRSGFGLRSLEARARQLGGVLVVSSAPGQGTELQLTMPLRHEPA